MEETAVDVLDRLISEDDGSVEAWYLGGWCHWLLAQKPENVTERTSDGVQNGNSMRHKYLSTSRDWLESCLRLFALLEYEDEKLHQHANELMAELNQTLGFPNENNTEVESDAADWEDEGDDEDDNDDGYDDRTLRG